MSESRTQRVLFALLGLNRGGKILYVSLLLLAIPALYVWTVWLPGARFSDEDENLFRAARHGDRAGIEQSLAAGASVNTVSPIDGKTALSRAAVFGQADAVRSLLEHGADATARGMDGRSPLEEVVAARAEEKDAAVAHGLDDVAQLLRQAEGQR